MALKQLRIGMTRSRDSYPQAGEGDDEAADAVWKKKKNWTKLWRRVNNELSTNNKRGPKKRG